jgi:uncharacterized membrane protein HdeD (DUF308 family)
MLRLLSRYWWVVTLRGVCAIAIGILALLWPIPAVGVLVLLFGAFAFVDGIIALTTLFLAQPGGARSALLALQGVTGVATGVLTALFTPWVTLVLVYVIGAWAIVAGVFELLAALQFRLGLADELWLILNGVVSIAFGLIVFAVSPWRGAEIIGYLIGFYALFFGFALVGLSLRLRRLRAHFHDSQDSTAGPSQAVTAP